MRLIGLTLMLTITLAATVVQVQADSEDQRRSLVGLRGVQVLIEKLDSEAEKDGLSRSTLQTDVELKLRQAGIAVYTQEQSFRIPGSPYLYLNVSAFKSRPGLYSYAIHLRLEQDVLLARAPQVKVHASTWRATGGHGTVGAAKLATVRDDVRDYVDEFINAYLAANPKK